MTKRKKIGTVVAVVAVLVVAGGLMASNMGFKLNYTLVAGGQPVAGSGESGNSLDGHNTIGLPFFRQSGLNSASALRTDIGGATPPGIEKFLRNSNSIITYSGSRGQLDFALDEGMGYRVKINGATNQSYIIVGSDDPSFGLVLVAGGQPVSTSGESGTSLDGHNDYAYKYHSTSTTASQLRNEIGGGTPPGIEKFLRNSNSIITYSGSRGQLDFALVPGESYRIKINGASNVTYTASHY